MRRKIRGFTGCAALAFMGAACAGGSLPNVEAWGSGTYVPRVQTENSVPLGKARYVPFARYITSMHGRIHPVFAAEMKSVREAHPELFSAGDLVVTLEIAVRPEDGGVALMGVVKSSGSVIFDEVAIRAVQRSSPFDTPPPVLASPDGKVYLHWTFNSDPYEGCASRNARPYVLASSPLSTSDGGI